MLDAGATPTGRPYFVMEYVKGDAITEYANAHRLSVADRLDLMRQVCGAVQHAHQKGVIHRDIKPRNVLVSVVDGRPQARVIDFGIAKATSAQLTEKTLFTEHRQLIGTPEYMSPEQAEGSPDIDTRTDVYSLGVLLYELLSGATPLDGARLRSAAFGEMQRIIREEEPPVPSVRVAREPTTLAVTAAQRGVDPARLGTIIRGELDWIVMKALEKPRGKRYESPSALAQDLERYLAGQPVVAAPPSGLYRARKFVRRNRGRVIAVASLAAVVAAAAVTAWFLRRAHLRTEEADAEAERLRLAMDEMAFAGAPDASEDLKVRALLRARHVDLDARGTPLGEVYQEIGRQLGVPVRVEWDQVSGAIGGVDARTPVQLTFAGGSAEAAFAAIAASLHSSEYAVGMTVRDGAVVVSSRSAITRERVDAVYDLTPLLPDEPSEEDAQALATLILGSVDPEGWMENGGDVGSLKVLGTSLLVKQTPDNQRAVAGLLRTLYRDPVDVTLLPADDDADLGWLRIPPADAAAAEALAARPVTLAGKAVPLAEALESIGRQIGLPIRAEWTELARVSEGHLTNATPVDLDVQAAPAEAAIQAVADAVPGSWGRLMRCSVRAGGVVVTTPWALGRSRKTVAYDLSGINGEGDQPVDQEAVLNLVLEHVEPESWVSAGGTIGRATLFQGRLLVMHTPDVHRRVVRLLRTLAAPPADPAALGGTR